MSILHICALLIGLLTFSIAFKPDSDIRWNLCPEITPANTLTNNLEEFKSKFLSAYGRLDQNRNIFNSIPINVPTTEEEWEKMRLGITSAECAFINVPFLWNKPTDARSVQFFVKRFKARKPYNTGVVILLPGGPGSPGSSLDTYGHVFREMLNEEWDVIVPDYRGTGRSSRVGCNEPNSLFSTNGDEIEACIRQLSKNYTKEDLFGFSPQQAAADVRHLASFYRAEGKKVVVYAVSYGTFVLNKLLSLYPDALDGAVADSVVPITADVSKKDFDFEEAANMFISTCQNTSFCRSKFTNITYVESDQLQDIFVEIFNKQKGNFFSYFGQCMPTFYTSDYLRLFFTHVMQHPDSRRIIFPLLYRLHRCSINDMRWLLNFFIPFSNQVELLTKEANPFISLNFNIFPKLFSGGYDDDYDPLSAPAPFSNELFMIISSAELTDWTTERKLEDYQKKFEQAYPPFVKLPMEKMITSLHHLADWRYRLEKPNRYATNFNGSLLILQGTLDTLTPPSYGRQWESVFAKMPKKYFYWFPNADHGVAFSTFLKNDKTQTCGRLIIEDYILKIGAGVENPQPKTTCLTQNQYMDAAEYDFTQFQFENAQNTAQQSQLLQDMRSYLLLHVDFWDGMPMLSFFEIACVVFPGIALLISCVLCSILCFMCCVSFICCAYCIAALQKVQQIRNAFRERKYDKYVMPSVSEKASLMSRKRVAELYYGNDGYLEY